MPRALAVALLLTAAHGVACADQPPGEDAAIAAEVAASRPSPTQAELPPPPLPSATRLRMGLGRFVDHFDLGKRLASLKTLKLVSLWDSRRLSVYFGVNHRGMPGLHFQQQDPGYVARVAAEMPPDNMPPLRAVPLASP